MLLPRRPDGENELLREFVSNCCNGGELRKRKGLGTDPPATTELLHTSFHLADGLIWLVMFYSSAPTIRIICKTFHRDPKLVMKTVYISY